MPTLSLSNLSVPFLDTFLLSPERMGSPQTIPDQGTQPAGGMPLGSGTLLGLDVAELKSDQLGMVVLPPADEDMPTEMTPVAGLPVELDVVVPVHEFRVRNLLCLQAGQLVETRWSNGEDVPLAAGEVRLAWGEFEVIEGQLAVRVTRLD